ncbi:MAG: cobalamin adenosyltransferase [Firmicutes bacterium]|nr:cobalamin adenosyltransferase [Bacillota bacterium]
MAGKDASTSTARKLVTEAELRALLKEGPLPRLVVSPGTLVTPAAVQFIKDWKMEVVSGEEHSMNLSAGGGFSGDRQNGAPAVSYTCRHCGGTLAEKPEHFTHLRGQSLVRKDHPRVRLRGKLDTLQAFLIEAQVAAGTEGQGQGHGQAGLIADLEELLQYTRRVLAAEVKEAPFEEIRLMGLNAEEIRRHSHYPKDYYGVDHLLPGYQHGLVLSKINLARTLAREAEIVAVEAFVDSDGRVAREDLLRALNRLSSALYIIACRLVGGHYQAGR